MWVGIHSMKFVKRCVTEIMTNSLAVQYAYDGTKKNKSFKTLKLNSVI